MDQYLSWIVSTTGTLNFLNIPSLSEGLLFFGVFLYFYTAVSWHQPLMCNCYKFFRLNGSKKKKSAINWKIKMNKTNKRQLGYTIVSIAVTKWFYLFRLTGGLYFHEHKNLGGLLTSVLLELLCSLYWCIYVYSLFDCEIKLVLKHIQRRV